MIGRPRRQMRQDTFRIIQEIRARNEALRHADRFTVLREPMVIPGVRTIELEALPEPRPAA